MVLELLTLRTAEQDEKMGKNAGHAVFMKKPVRGSSWRKERPGDVRALAEAAERQQDTRM